MIKITIVEDDYRIANIHDAFIKKVEDVTVVGKAINGKEALKIVENNQVDLIILDIYMPDMLGTEIIDKVYSLNPSIDFIVISAATQKEVIQKAIRGGVFDYIIKPVKMDRLISTIERYIKMKRKLETTTDIDQTLLDDYFGHRAEEVVIEKDTPKGIDPLTLNKIKEIINQSKVGMTAEEMGTQIGASRTTARRYLEYLISTGAVVAELEYGIVGRPERKYCLKD